MRDRPELIKNESGIVERHGIYFHDPSPLAKEHLFYPNIGATYTVEPPYRVSRGADEIHWYLLMSIQDGAMYVNGGKGWEIARNDDMILIDTSLKHSYYVKDKTVFQWLMFSGALSSFYYDLLTKTGVVHRGQSAAGLVLDSILSGMKNGTTEEHRVSAYLYDILTRLTQAADADCPDAVTTAIKYMEYHYSENISLGQIAEQVSLHPVYLSRIFKKAAGDSPHSWLIRIRLRHAKQMLTTTSDTIEEISARCGFQSSTHFIRAFRQRNMVTPQMFRKYFTPSGFDD